MKARFLSTIILAACLPLSAISAAYGALSVEQEEVKPVGVTMNAMVIDAEIGMINIAKEMLIFNPDVNPSAIGKYRNFGSELYFDVIVELRIPKGGLYNYWFEQTTAKAKLFDYVTFTVEFADATGLDFASSEFYAIGKQVYSQKTYCLNKTTGMVSSFSLLTYDGNPDITYDRNSIFSIAEERLLKEPYIASSQSGYNPTLHFLDFQCVFSFPVTSDNPSVSVKGFKIQVSNSYEE